MIIILLPYLTLDLIKNEYFVKKITTIVNFAIKIGWEKEVY